MTLLTQVSRVAYQADGVSRNFPIPFRIWSAAGIEVLLRPPGSLDDRLQTSGVDYVMEAATLPGHGAVVLATPPEAGTRVVIERRAELVQELDLVASGAFSAETIEDQFDRLTANMQAMAGHLGRAPRLPAGSAMADLTLPEPAVTRAGQLIGIAADGQSYECKVPAALGLHTVSAFAATLLDDTDAAAARATLGIAGPAALDLDRLPTDLTGGAAGDHVPFADASEAHAANKVPVAAFMANAVAGLGPVAGAQDHELLARSTVSGTAGRLPSSLVGAGRQTIWIPAAALQPRLSAGAAASTVELSANRLVLRTLDFDPALPEHAQVLVQMPKGWNRGPLTAVVLWTHGPAAAPFNVVWGLRLLATGDAGSLAAGFGPTVLVTDTGGAADTLCRSGETAGLVPATPAGENSLIALEVLRAAGDPADTLSIDARLIGIALHYVTASNTDG